MNGGGRPNGPPDRRGGDPVGHIGGRRRTAAFRSETGQHQRRLRRGQRRVQFGSAGLHPSDGQQRLALREFAVETGTGQRTVQSGAEGPDVRRPGRRFAEQQAGVQELDRCLRRHPGERRSRREHPRQAQVGQLPAALVQHHVAGFDIAVGQSGLVQRMDGQRRMLHGAEHLVPVQRSGRGGQRPEREVLHGVEEVVLQHGVVDPGQVGRVDRGESPQLTGAPAIGVLTALAGEDLHRDELVGDAQPRRRPGQVEAAVVALSDQPDDLEVRELGQRLSGSVLQHHSGLLICIGSTPGQHRAGIRQQG